MANVVNYRDPLDSISAERRKKKEVKEGEQVLRSERYFGKVSRSFQLPLPKKTAAQARRLTIE